MVIPGRIKRLPITGKRRTQIAVCIIQIDLCCLSPTPEIKIALVAKGFLGIHIYIDTYADVDNGLQLDYNKVGSVCLGGVEYLLLHNNNMIELLAEKSCLLLNSIIIDVEETVN